MPRNDSKLYSGLVAPVRRERIQQEQEQPKRDPRADLVLDEIANLKQAATNVSNILLDDSMDEKTKLRNIERSRDRYQDLAALERRMQKLLGVKT